jgi:Tfp pilus assembly protein PilN
MARCRYKAETSDDILFFHRRLPAGTADPILYIEDQIEELLFTEETLADVVYRYAESGDEVLIALAHAKTLERTPLPAGKNCYRIPAAIDLWLRAKATLEADRLSLLLGKHGENVYLLCADALRVHRVYTLADGGTLERDALLAIDKIREKYPAGGFPMTLFAQEPVSESLTNELRSRSVECRALSPAAQLPDEKAALDEWDFRLPAEVAAQEQNRLKIRLVKSGIATIGAVAAAWLLLFGAGAILDGVEKRSSARWQGLHGSLHEISYLQKRTGQCIVEIMLCRKLSEKRTNRAALLQKISSTRPEQVNLEQLQIGARKKRYEKGDATPASNDAVVLKGYGSDGGGITEWMAQLQKGDMFSSVNLLSMEKKDGAYRFTIECTLAAR